VCSPLEQGVDQGGDLLKMLKLRTGQIWGGLFCAVFVVNLQHELLRLLSAEIRKGALALFCGTLEEEP
jgi:hypothetical protein